METETPFTDSLLEWGHSGSFYPILIPDPASREALELLQDGIVEQSPASNPSTNLHSTLFYIKPTKLFEKLKVIKPGYREEQLYLELTTTMSTLIACFSAYTLDTKVEGIERFGPNQEMLALKLADVAIRNDARALLRRNLGFSGFAPDKLDALAEDPAYQWVFGPSEMHISLASSVGEGLDIDSLPIPDVITFSGLGDGSVQAPGETVDERHQWYLMGI